MAGKPLGELNGKYALLFKINMIVLPIFMSALLTWGVWVTASIYDLKGFAKSGARFTLSDAIALEKDLRDYMDHEFKRKEN